MNNINPREIEMIKRELTPKCETHISADFSKRVLAQASMRQRPRRNIRLWHWLSASGIAACVALTLIFNPGKLSASTLLQDAISYLSDIRSMVMEVEIRTSPTENFKLITPDSAFVNHQISVVYGDKMAWSVNKQGRMATGEGEIAYTWIPDYHIGWKTDKGKEKCLYFISTLLEPNHILQQELELSQKQDGDEYLVKTVGDEIFLTVHAYRHYNYTNGYLLNTSLEDAEHIRHYVFDKATKQLKQLSVSIISDGKETEVLRTKRIDYSVALGMDEVVDIPKDIDFIDDDSPSTKRKYIYSDLSAKEVAEKMLNAFEHWDEEVLDELMPASVAEFYRSLFEGSKLLSIGNPFTSGSLPYEYVPYVLQLRDSITVQHNLSLSKDGQGEWIFCGGL